MLLEASGDHVRVANSRLLAYIATLHATCVGVGLEIYLPMPALRRGLWRVIYASPAFIDWVNNDLPNIMQRDPADPIPAAQLDAELREFCNGAVLVYDRDFRCLRPIEKAVWELKTFV